MKQPSAKRNVFARRVGYLIPVVIAFITALFSAVPAHAAPLVVIDTFTQPSASAQQAMATWDGIAGFPLTGESTADDTTFGTILGMERDIAVTLLSTTTSGNRVRVTAGGADAYLSFSSDQNTTGTATISWDGNDNDAGTLDHTGLGGVDFTAGGTEGFMFAIVTADQAATITMRVYTSASDYSTIDVATSAVTGSTPDLYTVFFADFTDVGNGVDWTNVGAMELFIDGSAVPSLDLSIDIFEVNDRDFGDMPAAYAMTTLADNGAYHTRGDIFLGSAFDGETNGTPSADADADDTGSDDEDGVAVSGSWSLGAGGGAVDVTVGGGDGCLYGWFDFNQDGDFGTDYSPEKAAEQAITDVYVTQGSNQVTIDIPADATFLGNGNLFARFRLVRDTDSDGDCTDETEIDETEVIPGFFSGEGYLGGVVDGEVEDYAFAFSPSAITMTGFTQQQTPTDYISLFGVMLLLTAGSLWLMRRRRLN